MTKISKKILFFGNERLATGVSTSAPTLTALIEAGYQVVAVVSSFERGTSRTARDLEIAQVARKHNIPLLLPSKPGEIIDELKAYDADVAVLVAYGKIVPQSVIDIFPKGIVNIHPSLLPLHRGPTPIESVILDGSTKTGVSLMKLAKEMDAGPVYAQSELQLTGKETKQELADKALVVGGGMLIELLPGIMDGSVVAIAQDHQRATYDQLITKDAGLLDWNKPAIQLEREVRAYALWPKSRATIAGKEVIVLQASVTHAEDQAKPGKIMANNNSGVVSVTTSEGLLRLEKLQPVGKSAMTAAEFIRGYGAILG